jgi:type IV pilus assembly protein PilP
VSGGIWRVQTLGIRRSGGRSKLVAGCWLLVAGTSMIACSDKVVTSSSANSSPSVVDRKPQAPATAADAGTHAKLELQEVEFSESERSRDPFRAYTSSFVEEARTQTKSQREVVMEDFSIDDMRLIGIVTGGVEARAMLVDPRGYGHVVHRGQFIGRSEVVQGEGKGNKSYEINWRVDRIREGDVVLVREDPKNPEIPSSTRVLVLHPQAEATLIERP